MGEDRGSLSGLVLKYTLEEKYYKDHPVLRVNFLKDGEKVAGRVERTLNFRRRNPDVQQCNKEILYLKVNLILKL